MSFSKILGAFVALLTVISPRAAAFYPIAPLPGDVVVNGGFESGGTGWAFANGPNVGALADPTKAFTGNGYAYFATSGHQGKASQTVPTVASSVYIINFHTRMPPNAPPSSFTFKLNGVQQFAETGQTATDYVLHTYAFTSTSLGPTLLEFFGQYDNDVIYLDDVSVVRLPVPCTANFYEFDPATGNIKADAGKIYPGPPQPDSTFPVITDAGQLLFNYKSDVMAHTFSRVVTLALAPTSGPVDFSHTSSTCQWKKSQGTNCPSYSDIGFVFSKDVSYTIQENFDTLYVKGCVTRTIAPDFSTVTYSGNAFTIYQDPYNLGNRWSELKPIAFSMKLPYTKQATTTAVVDVVSDVVSVEYQPVEVINQGTSSNPIVQFTTITRAFYPFVGYGNGAKYSPPSSGATSFSDPSGNGVCTLYQSSGQVASTTSFCDSHPGVCTVECVRIIPITAPVCDLSGYTWEFDFQEYQDFSLTAPAHTLVSDPSQTPFFRTLNFDSSPVWNVCPTAASSDYARFTFSDAVHGHYDTTSGVAVADLSAPASINRPVSFGFKIYIAGGGPGNPTSNSATKIYKARLTEMKVTRPDSTAFYLVGSSSNPTVGGSGPDQNRAHDLTFTPSPVSNVYNMFVSPQVVYSDPKFAAIAVTFTPNVGSSSGPNMLYYSDSNAPGGVTLTVTFAGVISLFADGSTPSKRDIHFRRQVSISPNGTYADPSQVVNSLGMENSTTIVIQVPKLVKAINAATIAGSVVGGVLGLGLLVIAFLFYRRSKKASQFVISSEKMETASI